MIFPDFPGVPSFFQVFQVEWEPCKQYQMQQTLLQKLHSITGLSPNSKFASKPQRGIITIYGLCLSLAVSRHNPGTSFYF